MRNFLMRMMERSCFILIFGMLFSLTGCSLFSPVKVNNNSNYMLNRTPDSLPKQHKHNASILVQMPYSTPAYNTTQMAYTTLPYRISYFSENSWAETPAQMLEPLIVQTLQKSNYFKTVVSAPFAGHYNYLLSTTIVMLEQDFLYEPSFIRFKLRAQLTNAYSSRVLATKEISVTQPVRQNTPYGGVLAANAAVSKALAELAAFCQKNAR